LKEQRDKIEHKIKISEAKSQEVKLEKQRKIKE